MLDVVSLDFASLGFDCVEEVTFEELAFDDFVTELFSTDEGCEDGTLEITLDSAELTVEFSKAGVITGTAGEIGAFPPTELNEPEAGAQPIRNISTIRIETIFFIFFVNSPKNLRYRLIIPKSP